MMESEAMKENKNEEDKEIEANAALLNKYLHWKPLKIFFRMFKLIGMNIDLNVRNKRVSIFTWIYFILLLPIPIITIALQIYLVCFNSDSNFAKFTAKNTEHYVLLSAMFVVALRHSQINELVTDSLHLLIQLSKNTKNCKRSLTKGIILFTIIGLLDYILLTFMYFINILIPSINNESWIPHNYTYFFGIQINDSITVNLAENFEFAFYTILSLCSHVFCALLLFILFAINQSYRQLNENFKTEEEKSSKTFMMDHLKMAGIVERFNQVSTPAMLVVLSMHMLDFVTTAYSFYNDIKSGMDTNYIIYFIIESIILCAKTLVEFMLFTKFRQEIQNQAKDSISILLNADICNEDDKPTKEKSNTTNLFTAKMTSSPITICANYFVVDYDLVKIGIAIAAAYITFIEGFDKVDKNSTKKCNNNYYTSNYYCANETSNLTAA